MTIRIREAEPRDYEDVAELGVRAYLPCGLPSNHPYFGKLRDVASRAQEAVLLVATDAGRVVGTVTWCPEGSPYREIAQPDEAEFRMLAVDPEEQQHGVGRALVQACIDRAREEGRRALVLSSARWMATAQRLYEAMGFVRTPELDWSPREGIDLKTFRYEL